MRAWTRMIWLAMTGVPLVNPQAHLTQAALSAGATSTTTNPPPTFTSSLLMDVPVPVQPAPLLGVAPLDVPGPNTVATGSLAPTMQTSSLPQGGSTSIRTTPTPQFEATAAQAVAMKTAAVPATAAQAGSGYQHPSLLMPVGSTDMTRATGVVARNVLWKMTGVPSDMQFTQTQFIRPRSVDSKRPNSSQSNTSGRSSRSSRRSLPTIPTGPGRMAMDLSRPGGDDTKIILSSASGQRGAPMHSSPVDPASRQVAMDSLTNRLSTMTLAQKGDRTATPELSAVLPDPYVSVQAQVDAMDSVVVALTSQGLQPDQIRTVKELLVDQGNQHVDKTALTLAAQQDAHDAKVQQMRAEVQSWKDVASRQWEESETRRLQTIQMYEERVEQGRKALDALKATHQVVIGRVQSELAALDTHAKNLDLGRPRTTIAGSTGCQRRRM